MLRVLSFYDWTVGLRRVGDVYVGIVLLGILSVSSQNQPPQEVIVRRARRVLFLSVFLECGATQSTLAMIRGCMFYKQQ